MRLSPVEIAEKMQEHDRSINKNKKPDGTQKIQNKSQALVYQLTLTWESGIGYAAQR